VLSHGPIEMVVEEHLVRRDGQPVTLSPREFRLLQFLMEHQGRVWHREELLSRVWGELEALDFDPKTVDVHIHWLRLKLEADPAHPCLITTVRGRGYCLG
jgi:two-component system phosphate regulon response regulator PhoB